MNEDKVTAAGAADNGTETSYGKFKSAEELLRAYNSLETEFTKRSQKLSEYERRETGFDSKVTEFVKNYPIAEKYADEIAAEIKDVGEIGERELERALLTVLSGKVKTAEQMAADDEVVRLVLKSENNRKAVINDYLDGVRRNGAPVTLPKGGATPVTPPSNPRTIKEAGSVAIKILTE